MDVYLRICLLTEPRCFALWRSTPRDGDGIEAGSVSPALDAPTTVGFVSRLTDLIADLAEIAARVEGVLS
jgi:hypothetical protein